jgi:hypothetical protein
MLRLLIALGVGFVVSAIAVISSWRNEGGNVFLQPERFTTRRGLERLDQAIAAYRKETGKLPATLSQIPDPELLVLRFEDGVLRDFWGGPILYTTDGENYTILSHGSDGKPGGRGLACDLSNHDLRPRNSYPTLGQFLFAMHTEYILLACLGGGALAFLTALVTIRGPDLQRSGWASLAVKLGTTILATTLVAGLMSALEVPSGH